MAASFKTNDITLCNCQIKVNEQINTKNTGFANSFSKSAW